ncbi:T9SS type A sorting domain-containing protein [Flavobacterium sp.]
MKKICIILLCFFSSMSFAQMTMKKLDGTPINNGDVFTYTVLGDSSGLLDPDPAYFGFKIYNSSNSNISVKMKCIAITGGASGNSLQFCIDPICIGSIIVGNSYPADMVSTIPANGSNGNFDHFINFDGGTGNNIIDYVLKFYMLGSFGEEVGTPITMTYRYNPTLSTQGFSSLSTAGINVVSSLVNSQIQFNTTTNGSAQLFDLNGRQLSTLNFASGNNSIDVSNLSAAVYILNFTTQEGKSGSLKIIKQ